MLTLCLLSAAAMPDTLPAADTRPTVQQLRLDNGLEAVWEEDGRQPLVAIEARIKGGLRGEGRYVGTGITHFIEHMLFKGTPTRPSGTIEQEVRRYGGTINAFTSLDTTGVTLFVEARHLRDALGMLADILQHAVFDQVEFDKERAVIISEIQMNLDDPDRRIHQMFWSRHFLEHPYRHPILGYQPLLESLTVKELTEFYAAQYQPQHITLSCVGDIDTAAFPGLVKELFGSWKRGRVDPAQQLVADEPPSVTAKTVADELPVQAAYVQLGFSSTDVFHPDLYALDVLSGILGHGDSSRLYETLVRKRRLAHAVTSWNYTPFDPGVFGIQFRTDAEHVEAATQAVIEILRDVRQRGITAAELRKAKRQVKADYVFGLQTIESRAGDLANSLSQTGDPMFTRRYVTGVERVTAEQVQSAAQRYCVPDRMTSAIIRPAAGAAKAGPASAVAPAGIGVTKTALGNGMTALIGTDAALPIAAIVVAYHAGSRVETAETEGLSNFVANMLTRGTKRRSASEIAQAVESLGARLEPFSGRDTFGLVMQLLSEDLPEGLALMQELVHDPAFREEELEIQRQLILKELESQEDEIFQVGSRLMRRTLFGSHPYALHPLGGKDTVAGFRRGECVEFAKTWLAPSNGVVAVFGAIDGVPVGQQLARLFGQGAASRAPAWPPELPVEGPNQVREAFQPMDKEQALILLGFLGSRQTAEDRYAIDVMTAVLSGMAGRLFQAVRERYGLSYTLGAMHTPGWDRGALTVYAATRPGERDKVVQVLDEQLQQVSSDGFTDAEVDQARRYLIGLHRMDIQGLVGLTKRVVIDELNGLGFDAWRAYEDRINAVTVPRVHEAAKRYLTLDRRARVIVGPNGAAHD